MGWASKVKKLRKCDKCHEKHEMTAQELKKHANSI